MVTKSHSPAFRDHFYTNNPNIKDCYHKTNFDKGFHSVSENICQEKK